MTNKRKRQNAKPTVFPPRDFLPKWLHDDLLKKWVDRDEEQPTRARCKCCNLSLGAFYSTLKRHGVSTLTL